MYCEILTLQSIIAQLKGSPFCLLNPASKSECVISQQNTEISLLQKRSIQLSTPETFPVQLVQHKQRAQIKRNTGNFESRQGAIIGCSQAHRKREKQRKQQRKNQQ